MNNKIKILACLVLAVSVVASVAVAGNAASIPADAKIYGNNAYKCYTREKSYALAAEQCRSMGGHLVYVESTGELNFLKSMGDTYWCGATGSDGNWSWGGSGSVDNSFWLGGSAPAEGTNAVVNLTSGNLQPQNSGDEYAYICEWEGGAASLTSAVTTTSTTATTATTKSQSSVSSSSASASSSVISSVSNTAVTEPTVPTVPTLPEQITDSQVPISAVSRVTVLATLPTTAVTVIMEGGGVSVNADPLAALNIGDTIFVYENQFYYKVADDSEVVIAYYVGDAADVEIPSEIDDMPVKYISQRAFQKVQLTSVAIPPSVLIIDDSAFCNVADGFTVYGAKGTAAEIFAAKFGHQFAEREFEDDDAAAADGSKAKGDKTADGSLSGVKLIWILVGIGVVFAAAAVGVFLFLRKKRMAEEMMEAMGFDDEDADDGEENADGDEDDEDDDMDLKFDGESFKFTESAEQPALVKAPKSSAEPTEKNSKAGDADEEKADGDESDSDESDRADTDESDNADSEDSDSADGDTNGKEDGE